MTEELKPMSVKEMRDKIGQAKIITLPSGAVVKVRHLTPMDYIREGMSEIPNEFYLFVAELQSGKLNIKNDDENRAKKNWDTFEKFVNITLDKGVIEPLITFRYDEAKKDTHLLYSELSGEDQAVLISAIIGK